MELSKSTENANDYIIQFESISSKCEENMSYQDQPAAVQVSEKPLPRQEASKNVLVDGEEKELKCPVCLDFYTCAISLFCYHVFCKQCISLWCKKENSCPLCRATIIVAADGEEDFGKSNAIEEIDSHGDYEGGGNGWPEDVDTLESWPYNDREDDNPREYFYE